MNLFAEEVTVTFGVPLNEVWLDYGAMGLIAPWLPAMIQLAQPADATPRHQQACDLASSQLQGLIALTGTTRPHIITRLGEEIVDEFYFGFFDPDNSLAFIGVFAGGEPQADYGEVPFYKQFHFDAKTLDKIGENQLGYLVIRLPGDKKSLRAAAVATIGREYSWDFDAHTVPHPLRARIIQEALKVIDAKWS